jgi:probable HAF family extracellular repeat protein
MSLCFFRTLAALALSVPTGTWAGSHGEYVITEVIVPNRTAVFPAKINDQGEILGEARDARDGRHPFLYKEGTLQQLGMGEEFGYPVDLNNAGEILCYLFTESQGFFPALIHSNGNVVNLNTVLGGKFYAQAMNDLGDIVLDDSERFLVYNNLTGIIHPLDNPLGLEVSDINNSGQVIGIGGVVEGAATLVSGNNYVSFKLPGQWEMTSPFVINNLGQVAGIGYNIATSTSRPFIYQDGHFTRFNNLPGDALTEATGINDRGELVGLAWRTSDGLTHAFLYSDHKLQDLNALIPARSGWNLEYAVSINNHGQIVGAGTLGGRQAGFLLTPITPSSN